MRGTGDDELGTWVRQVMEEDYGGPDGPWSVVRVYKAGQVLPVVKRSGIPLPEAAGSIHKRLEAWAEKREEDGFDFSSAVGNNDHAVPFELLAYRMFPVEAGGWDLARMVAWLQRQGFLPLGYQGGVHRILNGFATPLRRAAVIESLLVRPATHELSVVLGQARIMRKPGARGSDVSELFVARVPSVVTFDFARRVLEFSMPTFAEPLIESYHRGTYRQWFPGRVTYAIRSAFAALQASGLCPWPGVPIKGGLVTLKLEQQLGATDHGWDIERLSTGGEFDVQQMKGVPLKRILEEFQAALVERCGVHGKKNPLAGVDLYSVFRTLKAESHTNTMILQVPLGRRGGKVRLTTLYGRPEDGVVDPVFWVLGDVYSDRARILLRQTVVDAQRMPPTDPYSFENFDHAYGS